MVKACATCKHESKTKNCLASKNPVEECIPGAYPFPYFLWEPKTDDVNPSVQKHAYELLNDAAKTLKERGKHRDDGEERSMAKTVELFNKLEGSELTEVQGWRFMVLLKLVRQQNSVGKCEDSFIDAIGYAALMAEAALNKLNKEK